MKIYIFYSIIFYDMPTANNLGLVEEAKIQFPTKLTTGMVLEVSKLPEFRTPTEEFEYESVVLSTVSEGDFYTTSKVIIGSLKSVNPKSTGAVLRKAIEHNNTLTVYINDFVSTTGRTGMSIGLFKKQ
jgi:hypothetical protein